MKKVVRIASTNPRSKIGIDRTPMAKDETHILAASHCITLAKIPSREQLATYHGANLHCALIRALILRYTLNTSRLNTEPRDQALQLSVRGIAVDERFAVDSARLVRNDAAAMFLTGCIVLHIVGLVVVDLDILLAVLRHYDDGRRGVLVWGGVGCRLTFGGGDCERKGTLLTCDADTGRYTYKLFRSRPRWKVERAAIPASSCSFFAMECGLDKKQSTN
jgi:hypothetical protein